MKRTLWLLAIAASAAADCRIHLVKNPDAVVLNGREFSTCAVKDENGDEDAAALQRPLQVGDRIGLRFKDGTNVVEEVTSVVTNVHQVEFSDGARLEVGDEPVIDVIRTIMQTEDMLHTRQSLELPAGDGLR